jgi:hypothetical protein
MFAYTRIWCFIKPVLLLTPIALSVKDNKNFLMSRTAFLRKLDAEHSIPWKWTEASEISGYIWTT